MEINDPKAIFSCRLLRARRMRGMSLRALAEATAGKVSHNALSRYEKGIMLPGSEILLAVSKALDQKPDYFFRPFEVQLDGIKFRKVSKLSEKYQYSIEEAAFDYVERYSEIEQILGLKTSPQNPIEDLLVQVPNDVESAAEQLRKAWHLGEDPLASTIEVSEGNGVKVVEVDSPKEFNGLSGQANSCPVIVLAKWLKNDLSRKRLTILHEIGHLLLRFSSAIDKRTEEKLCHRFAGAMLIPKRVFKEEFGGVRRQVWLKELLDIKLRYGISLAAIVQRALDLKLIDQYQHRIFQKYWSIKGWRKDEPGSYVGREFSSRFEQLVLRAAAEEYISSSKAASLLRKSLSEIKSILPAVA